MTWKYLTVRPDCLLLVYPCITIYFFNDNIETERVYNKLVIIIQSTHRIDVSSYLLLIIKK